jgi:hypothetical protein
MKRLLSRRREAGTKVWPAGEYSTALVLWPTWVQQRRQVVPGDAAGDVTATAAPLAVCFDFHMIPHKRLRVDEVAYCDAATAAAGHSRSYCNWVVPVAALELAPAGRLVFGHILSIWQHSSSAGILCGSIAEGGAEGGDAAGIADSDDGRLASMFWLEVEWHASPAFDQQYDPQLHLPLVRSARGGLRAENMPPRFMPVIAIAPLQFSVLPRHPCSEARAHRRRAAVDDGARHSRHGPVAVVVEARQMRQPGAVLAEGGVAGAMAAATVALPAQPELPRRAALLPAAWPLPAGISPHCWRYRGTTTCSSWSEQDTRGPRGCEERAESMRCAECTRA